MRTCPACEEPIGDLCADACPSCGSRVECATETFAAVSDNVADPALVAESGDLETGPMLLVRKGPDVGERFVIDRARLSVGRDPDSDIFLNDVTVSRNHAVLLYGGGEVILEDSGSLNGTYVNGVRVDRAPLGDGDVLQVGTFQMVFMGAPGHE